jgi:hypothetical protein
MADISEKERQYRREWYRRRTAENREYTRALKLERGCIDCGYADDATLLDFDHRPSTVKVYNVSMMLGFNRKKLDAEIEKCDVRCHWCHTARHAIMSSPSFPQWRGGRPGSARDPKTGRLVSNV